MSITRPDTEPELINEMIHLINQMHDRPEAIRIANEFIERFGQLTSAHTYFQLALAYSLIKQEAGFRQHWENAKRCADYSDEMEGDFYRDLALLKLRLGQRDFARTTLLRAAKLHELHPAKQAADILAQGKIDLMSGDFDEALECFQTAETALLDLAACGESWDEQHLRNTRWWTLIVAARTRNEELFQTIYHDLTLGFEVFGLSLPVRVIETTPLRRRLAVIMQCGTNRGREMIARMLVWESSQ